MAWRGQSLVGLVHVDLALDGVDVCDRAEVEASAPDERIQLLEESLSARQVSGAGPGLDVGGPLPVLAHGLVVVERRLDRHGGGRGGGIGPQPEVDAEDIAQLGPFLQEAGERLGQLGGEGLWLHAGGQRQKRRLIEDRDIDVAGVVEL